MSLLVKQYTEEGMGARFRRAIPPRCLPSPAATVPRLWHPSPALRHPVHCRTTTTATPAAAPAAAAIAASQPRLGRDSAFALAAGPRWLVRPAPIPSPPPFLPRPSADGE